MALNGNEIPLMPNAKQIIAKNLGTIRESLKISQEDVAESGIMSQKTVSNVENVESEGNRRIDMIEALAAYYRLPLWVVCLEDMPSDPLMRKLLIEAVRALSGLSETGLRKVLERIEEVKLLEDRAANG